MLAKKTKIFIVDIKFYTGEDEAIALTEFGEIIAYGKYQYVDDIPYDFGVRGFNNKKNHNKYDFACPKGYELILITEAELKNMKKNSDIEKALKNLATQYGTLEEKDSI